jgi:hypothetical protein
VSAVRGIAAAAGLGLRRARVAPGRWVAVAIGVALAVGLLGGLSAAGVVAGDHAARRTIAALPPARRTVLLSWDGGATPAIDRVARGALARVGGHGVTRALMALPTHITDRGTVRLGGIAPAQRWLRLISGRLPRGSCTAARCEVVAVGGPPARRRVSGRGVHLVVVGSGVIASVIPLGFRTRGPSRRARGPSMLVSADPAGVDGLTGLDSVYRTQTWSASLALGRLRSWQLRAAIERITGELNRIDPDLTPTAPVSTLALARSRAEAAPRRLRAAGATAAAALLAFVMLAAGALRGGLMAEDGRLRRSGATAPQRAALALAETFVPVLAGLAAGLALVVAVALVRAAAGGVDAGHVLGEALGGAAGQLAITGLVAWAAVVLVARAPARWGRLIAVAGLVAAVALLAGVLAPRGADGSDPLPDVVIPVAAAAAGVLVALLVPAVLRTLARAAPRRRPHARLALLELARDPGPAVIAVAGLAVAVGLGGFAVAYRATLDRSRGDQATQRVPLAATVTPGASLESPLSVRSQAFWRHLPGVTAALPVVRRSANWVVGPDSEPVTLLGLPAAAGLDPGPPRAPTSTAGIRLPPGARTLSVRSSATASLDVIAVVRERAGGTIDTISLGTAGAAARTLRGALPPRARGGTLISLEVQPPSSLLATSGHAIAEGGSGGDVSAGTASLDTLRAGGTALPALVGWSGHGAASHAAGALRFSFGADLQGIVRPPTPTDRAPLAVRVDADTAATIGFRRFTVDVAGVSLPVRVAGTVGRVPTIPAGDGVVLADSTALRDALDASSPGLGDQRELWLRAYDPRRLDAALPGVVRRAGLEARTHAAVRRAIESEPVTREVLGALAGAALLAALLAVAGVAVTIRRARRDGADTLLDLEAQGVGPAALRRALRLRGTVVVVLGVVPGIALAGGLTLLVTSAVRAGTGGAEPDPPLVAVVPYAAGVAAAAVLLIAAVLLAALVTAPALREPMPRTATGGGA